MHDQNDPKKIKIDCSKYFIRALTTEDASDRLACWFSDPNVLYALNAPARIWSKGDVANYINDFNHASKLLLGIFEKTGDIPIDIFTILINPATGQGLINILIGDAEYRNKGMRSRGVLVDISVPFLDFLFHSRGLTRPVSAASPACRGFECSG